MREPPLPAARVDLPQRADDAPSGDPSGLGQEAIRHMLPACDRVVIVPVYARMMLGGVGHKYPARAQQAGIGAAQCARRLGAAAAALGLMAVSCATGSGPGFRAPPRRLPVTTVLVSADGRVITGVGEMVCGHNPRLVARSYPRKVSLNWANPDTNCNAETTRSAVVRIRLPEPLGNRALVQVAGGGRIPYFDQRDLAHVTVLPAGFKFRSEFPAGQPAGDTRTYAGPAGTGAARPGWPCRCEELAISQQVAGKGFIPPTQQTGQRPVHVRVHGVVAALLVNGPFYARSINWADHGYYFTVGVAYGPRKTTLSNAQLVAVANGIRPSPGSAAS